ncbi:MAG: Gfo/Idh/MocA family oxidoreductase [Cyclobacteriaceae bacterium]
MKKINGNTVKWGILGVGDVCEVKSAPAMNKIPNSEITAVMRRNGAKAKDYAERHGISRWYDDVDQLLGAQDVNAIYIATPPNAHAELALKVSKAGMPVYIEKPMAKTHTECEQINHVFSKRGLPVYIAYYRRALPNFIKVKELIESGEIGDVRMLNIEMIKPLSPDIITKTEDNWRVNPEVAGGGYFYDLASHQFDFLDFLFGPVKEAKGISINQSGAYASDDITMASFSFEHGIVGNGTWCFTAGNSMDKEETTIIGSKGHITYSTFENSKVKLVSDETGEQVFDFEMPKHIQQPLIQEVVNDLLGVGKCPSTGKSGARTNLVLEQITQ